MAKSYAVHTTTNRPRDLAWQCCAYLTARDVLRCGAAGRDARDVFLADEPWDALRRRLARAAGLRPGPRGDVSARVRFFREAGSAAARVAAAAAPGECVLVVRGGVDAPRGSIERGWGSTEVPCSTPVEDALIQVDGVAYDVTAFAEAHPGGPELLLDFAGKDASAAFRTVRHSFYAHSMLERFVRFSPERLVGGRLRGSVRGDGEEARRAADDGEEEDGEEEESEGEEELDGVFLLQPLPYVWFWRRIDAWDRGAPSHRRRIGIVACRCDCLRLRVARAAAGAAGRCDCGRAVKGWCRRCEAG